MQRISVPQIQPLGVRRDFCPNLPKVPETRNGKRLSHVCHICCNRYTTDFVYIVPLEKISSDDQVYQ